MSSREFVETITKDLLGSRVFVFTPRGKIKNPPKGATVIDYAYMIHIEIGNKMVPAKVNGNLVSPAHVLANAEVVEIITYNIGDSRWTWLVIWRAGARLFCIFVDITLHIFVGL